MASRKEFLKQTAILGAGMALVPNLGMTSGRGGKHLTILHTNDWHSRIEPFPRDGGKLQGLGGAAKRAMLIKQIRAEQPNVILLDAGDVFQGTPYFNLFHGELEFKLMSAMGYDAITLGNHDFDGGLNNLIRQMEHASFQVVNGNYSFSSEVLRNSIHPHTVIEKGNVRVGIVGCGIELEGLVPKKLFEDTKYSDPVGQVNESARYLKEDLKCDLVICLSHLGYRYKSDKISDVELARKSEFVDVILGGHTHTFLPEPIEVINKMGQLVIVNQVGWAGVILGRIDISWNPHGTLRKPRSTMLKVS